MKLGFTRADITTRGRGRQHARPAGPSARRGPHHRRAQTQQQERERLREQRCRRMPLVWREIAEQPRVIPGRIEGQYRLQHAQRGRHDRGGDQQRRSRTTQRSPQPPRQHGGGACHAPQRHDSRCGHPVRRRERPHDDHHSVIAEMRQHGAGLRELPRKLDVAHEVQHRQHPRHDCGKGDQAHPRRQHQRDSSRPPHLRRPRGRRGGRENRAGHRYRGRPDDHAQPGECGQKQRQQIDEIDRDRAADSNQTVATGSPARLGRDGVSLPVDVVGVRDRRMLDNRTEAAFGGRGQIIAPCGRRVLLPIDELPLGLKALPFGGVH